MSTLLSVLIPAYGYPDGVLRILRCFRACNEIEVIIADDSNDHQVQNAVENFCIKNSMNFVKYLRNDPAKGAVDNWNFLLDKALGRYLMLCHHDEFPIGEHFFKDILTTLQKYPETDIVMLDCLLVSPNTGRSRRHLSTWLRALTVKHFPQYLFRRNVIGPTAALVVRRSIYPRFDERLQWLVDVDVYVRLLRVANHVRICSHIKIGSLLGRSDSITSRLGPSIPRMEQKELFYLRNKSVLSSFWIGQYPDEPRNYKLLRSVEAVCWMGMRVLTRGLEYFYPAPISRSEALSAVHGN
jgi:glycosyltransferase involved in cell wall biosynthesis